MDNNEYNELLSMLLKATTNNKIEWEYLQHSSDRFRAKVGDGYIGLSHTKGTTLSLEYMSLTVYNSSGQSIETYSFNEMEDAEQFKKLAKLYYIVNDMVFRITETKSSIFSALRGMTSDNKI